MTPNLSTPSAEEREPPPGDAAVSLRLPRRAESASTARRGVGRLAERLDRETLDDVRLLVTELVTNSVRHAGRGAVVGLDVFVTQDNVRIEVSDAGRGFAPRPRTADQSAEGGWGLHLVERLADRWGVRQGGPTLVWLEIDLPARSRAS
jgi:anti-sigma regulatory factor (Ser/Thr protein kinase)